MVRAKTEIEEIRGSRFAIIVTEIPYQVNKSSLIEKMAELVREDKLDQISDIRDESDRTGMRIVIEPKRGALQEGAQPPLQAYADADLLWRQHAGAGGRRAGDAQPAPLPGVYIEHRFEVLTQRTRFQLAKARERAHILEGLRIALEFLDEVIATIRASDSADAARTALMERFGLRRCRHRRFSTCSCAAGCPRTPEDRGRVPGVTARIAYYLDLLDHPEKLRALVRQDIMTLKEKFGDERRTAGRRTPTASLMRKTSSPRITC